MAVKAMLAIFYLDIPGGGLLFDTNMRHLLIGCTLLCSLAVCACSEKPYSEAVETFNEEMSGPYILHLAHWLGAGVFSGLNLNGDNGTGDDICQELIDYPNVSNL